MSFRNLFGFISLLLTPAGKMCEGASRGQEKSHGQKDRGSKRSTWVED
ncbi:hypothetical protein BRCON_2794 [Candidatus Sumerlaea chitinivorans]|uniref:Uncharacterized protein n=1 Tax=Sumerlaea chitinivorans TaxID=2250252 RepID=A0A2Z4Y920_SUMC1|nr:hypothetical protein BRCON_2794 [Candidatus Sumerlaea chitinivorans]